MKHPGHRPSLPPVRKHKNTLFLSRADLEGGSGVRCLKLSGGVAPLLPQCPLPGVPLQPNSVCCLLYGSLGGVGQGGKEEEVWGSTLPPEEGRLLLPVVCLACVPVHLWGQSGFLISTTDPTAHLWACPRLGVAPLMPPSAWGEVHVGVVGCGLPSVRKAFLAI